MEAALDLGRLFDARDGAIVTLVAGKTRLVAHKDVLAARSSGFRRLLQGRTGKLTVSDVAGLVLRQLLVFLYTGSVPAPQLTNMLPELLDAAEKYGVPGLEALCRRHLDTQQMAGNAAATPVLEVKYHCGSLRQTAVVSLKDNALVMATQDWGGVGEGSRLPVEPQAQGSAPPPAAAASGPSGSQSQAPAAAPAPPTAAHLTPPLDEAAVSRYRSLSDREKGERLREAAKEGREGEVAALLAAGADADAMSASGWSAVYMAAAEGHVGVIRLLAAASADLNGRDWQWRTPLHYAARNGLAAAAAALLQLGADRAAEDEYGDTPLDLAARNDHQQLVELLTSR